MTERHRKTSAYYPAFIRIEGKMAVVVGGGEVALRKVEGLLAAGAKVRVIAPDLQPDLDALAQQGTVLLIRRGYRPGDLEGAVLAVAATSDPETNRRVALEARERNLFLNVVDEPELCSFIVPSVIRREGLTVAISTSGLAPAVAKHLRQKLEEILVPEYGGFLRLLGTLRPRVREQLQLRAQRDAFWSEAMNSDAFEIYRERGESAALSRLEEMVGRVRDAESPSPEGGG